MKNKWQKHVEIVTLVIPTMNDDEEQLRQLADWVARSLGTDAVWHVTRFFPYLDYKHLPPTPVATLEKAQAIGTRAGLKYVYIGNVPDHPLSFPRNIDKLNPNV